MMLKNLSKLKNVSMSRDVQMTSRRQTVLYDKNKDKIKDLEHVQRVQLELLNQKDKTIGELERKVRDLVMHDKRQEIEIDKFRQLYLEAKAGLEGQQAKTEQAKAQLQEACTQLNEAKFQFNTKVNEKAELIENLRAQLAETSESTARQISALQVENAKLKQQLEFFSAQRDSTSGVLSRNFTSMLQQKESAIETLNEKVISLTTALNQRENENRVLDAGLKQLQSTLGSLTGKHKAELEAAGAEAREKMEAMSQAFALELQKAKSEQQNKSCRSCKALQEQLDDAASEVRRCKFSLAQKAEIIQTYKRKVDELENKTYTSSQAVAVQYEENVSGKIVQELKQQLKQQTDLCKSQQRQIAELTLEAEVLKNQTVDRSLRGLQQQIVETNKDRFIKNLQIQALKREVQSSKSLRTLSPLKRPSLTSTGQLQ